MRLGSRWHLSFDRTIKNETKERSFTEGERIFEDDGFERPMAADSASAGQESVPIIATPSLAPFIGSFQAIIFLFKLASSERSSLSWGGGLPTAADGKAALSGAGGNIFEAGVRAAPQLWEPGTPQHEEDRDRIRLTTHVPKIGWEREREREAAKQRRELRYPRVLLSRRRANRPFHNER